MFFTQLKAVPEDELAQALRVALPAPRDVDDCRRKTLAFSSFVEHARERAKQGGTAPPGLGRVPAFLTFFWEAVDRGEWPAYYPNSRDVLESHQAHRGSARREDRRSGFPRPVPLR